MSVTEDLCVPAIGLLILGIIYIASKCIAPATSQQAVPESQRLSDRRSTHSVQGIDFRCLRLIIFAVYDFDKMFFFCIQGRLTTKEERGKV